MREEDKIYINRACPIGCPGNIIDGSRCDLDDAQTTIATLSGVKKALESFVAGEQQVVDRYKPLCTIDPAEVRATHRLEAFQLVLRCFPDYI